MSYCHRFGPGMDKGLTFGQMLENSALRFPDNIAIWFGETRYTYGELKETVDRMATSLLKLGLSRGDRVGVLFPDWPEYTDIWPLSLSLPSLVTMFTMPDMAFPYSALKAPLTTCSS